ncbi:MAG: hypothetical protein JNK90_27155 [Planctomycetaceae bacterium]|nr:hypothetical protein [Planctomycetaceae bacterium]MBN8603360.1 hypothetical protein [Planctomycetota bacterium]
MNPKHPFFWLANGYLLAGLFAGLGLGIMWGPYLVKLMPNFNLNGMVGMLLIVVSTLISGFLQMKFKKVNEQSAS